MRQIRLLGLMLLAVFMLGSLAAATACAATVDEEHPGWLTLAALKEKDQIKAAVTSAAWELKVAGEAVGLRCTGVEVLKLEFGAIGDTHITLSLIDADLHFKGCKKGELGCRSEDLKAVKDPVETILVLVDAHLVALLKGTTLVPGVMLIILDQNTLELGTVLIKCGTGNVLVKGALRGEVTTGASLTEEVKEFTLVQNNAATCDTSDALCVKFEKELPPLANFKGTFEKLEVKGENKLTLNEKVLVDY
jgi:hypothetical protein